jgi:hypothetical protein
MLVHSIAHLAVHELARRSKILASWVICLECKRAYVRGHSAVMAGGYLACPYVGCSASALFSSAAWSDWVGGTLYEAERPRYGVFYDLTHKGA